MNATVIVHSSAGSDILRVKVCMDERVNAPMWSAPIRNSGQESAIRRVAPTAKRISLVEIVAAPDSAFSIYRAEI